MEDAERLFIIGPACFAFGTDAVLLAHFVQARGQASWIRHRRRDYRYCCAHISGLCVTGRGAAGLVDMAKRSVALNGLEERISLMCGDIREAKKLLGTGFDVVVTNPPYEKADSGKPHSSEQVSIAKRELLCTLEDVACSAAAVLRNGGRLYMIYPTARFAELMVTLCRYRLEPKRVQLVAPRADRAPGFALVEARKGACPGVQFLPQLSVYEADGTYTPPLKRIYGEGR